MAVSSGEAQTLVVRWQRRRGPLMWTEHVVEPWWDEAGQRVGFTARFRDVTAQHELAGTRETLERVQRDGAYFRTLIHTVNDGILVNDADGAIEFINHQLASLLRARPEEMIGRYIFDYIDEESAATARQNLQRRRSGAEDQFDFRWRRNDGSSSGRSSRPSRCTTRTGAITGRSSRSPTSPGASTRRGAAAGARPPRGPGRRAHRGAGARGPGAAAGRGGGAGGEPDQEPVPGEHEPRAAHAAQRDHRLRGAGPRGRGDAADEGGPRAGARGGGAPAGADQQHPRPVGRSRRRRSTWRRSRSCSPSWWPSCARRSCRS